MLGWHDTIAFLTIPIILIIAQAISLRILTPPSDDPTIQQSQRILKYLPLLIGYFSLSVPAGLGVYWITNNVLSTVSSVGIKSYLKANPQKAKEIDIEKLANSQNSALYNPAWGYSTREQMFDEAKLNVKPILKARIPENFI
jgi:YidC/Oxa1 family membrane protein insertase